MKKNTPSRLAPSRLAPSKRARSKRAPSRLAPSDCAPSRRLPVLALVLSLAVILAAAGGTAAIYTSQVFQRSVVRNPNTTAICFSSDKLYQVTRGTDAQTYYYPMSNKDQNTMTFQVCNYDQSQNTKFNEKTIGYTVTFTVMEGTPGFDYTITYGKTSQPAINNGPEVSFTSSLPGGKRSADSYTFTFKTPTPEDPTSDYNKVKLAVTVTPDNESLTATRNNILNGILIPIAYAATQGVTLEYGFPDSGRNTPDYFDAYNLSVSISGGEREVLITWDHTQLDIDPFFSAGRTITKDGNESTITVLMNSENETGVYLIQFYNHNTTKPDWKAWDQLPISVKLNPSQT